MDAMLSRTVIALTLALAGSGLVGCGDDAASGDTTGADTVATDTASTDTAVATDAPADVDATPAAPRIRFFIDERPQDDSDAEVLASVARWGDPIRVVVDGLAPGATVVLLFTSAPGTSQAAFVADGAGVVDLARDAPIDGDWQGVDRDGFTWSMHDPGPATQPPDLTLTAEAYVGGGEPIATATLARHLIDEDVVGEAVADGTARGVMVVPPGDGPFGGILCFGGSEGGTSSGEFLAYYYASLGYAALGVGYFGATGLPHSLDEVPLEILEDDLARLQGDPRVAPGGVVVVGGSRGGELALILGARFEAVAGVVALVPSGYVWGGFDVSGTHSAWTYGGVPLPFVPSSDQLAPIITSSEGNRGSAFTPVFLASIAAASPDALALATTHIEAIDGPVLLLGGGDDQLWPSCALADVAWQRLAGGHAALHGDENVCNPDAGHFSTFVPGGSAVGSTADYTFGRAIVVGGTVAGNGKARRVNDTRTRALLERVLGPGKIVAPSSQ